MNKTLVVGLVGAAVLGILALVIGGSYVSAFNRGNVMEQQIKAQYEQNQNVLAQYGQKVQEIASVPAMYRDDLKEVVTAAMQGRYGADGSKAVFQWIKEHNVNFDSTLYTKIQQTIEAGRNQFQNEQEKLIDIKRQYETQLGYFWGGMWLRIAGYPKINLADYKVVKTDAAVEAFTTGKEKGPIKLR